MASSLRPAACVSKQAGAPAPPGVRPRLDPVTLYTFDLWRGLDVARAARLRAALVPPCTRSHRAECDRATPPPMSGEDSVYAIQQQIDADLLHSACDRWLFGSLVLPARPTEAGIPAHFGRVGNSVALGAYVAWGVGIAVGYATSPAAFAAWCFGGTARSRCAAWRRATAHAVTAPVAFVLGLALATWRLGLYGTERALAVSIGLIVTLITPLAPFMLQKREPAPGAWTPVLD